MSNTLAVLTATIFLLYLGLPAARAQSAGHVMVTPDELVWTEMPTLPAGAEVALIEGPLDEPVPFTLRLRLPANFEIPAHRHPWIEHVTVLSSTLHMGVGDSVDRSKTKALSAGSAAIIQASTSHFSWTEGETVVQIHGVGPLVIHYVNPADDPRKQ